MAAKAKAAPVESAQDVPIVTDGLRMRVVYISKEPKLVEHNRVLAHIFVGSEYKFQIGFHAPTELKLKKYTEDANNTNEAFGHMKMYSLGGQEMHLKWVANGKPTVNGEQRNSPVVEVYFGDVDPAEDPANKAEAQVEELPW